MSRKKRIWQPGYIYHVTARGNNKNDLFLCKKDYVKYLEVILYSLKYYEDYEYEVLCYCLMTNHVHLLIKCNKLNPGRFIGMINKKYADYYNYKYNKIGHLFQGRYYSNIIKDNLQLLQASKYIHLNPVKAGIVDKGEKYKWSSYKQYISNEDDANLLINKNIVMDFFFKFKRDRGKAYKNFVEYKFKGICN